jgi:hypothetical protein
MASLTIRWHHHWRGIVCMRVGRIRIEHALCQPWSSSGSAGQCLLIHVSEPQAEHCAAASFKGIRLPLNAGSAPALKRR